MRVTIPSLETPAYWADKARYAPTLAEAAFFIRKARQASEKPA